MIVFFFSRYIIMGNTAYLNEYHQIRYCNLPEENKNIIR